MSSTQFHISLKVRDLAGTVSFLELLLGARPALATVDYAKFELRDPPLVLSLVPSIVPLASLDHLGFRLANREALDALERRISAAGVAHQREESVACCHSRQTKFWVDDPAGNHWEFYVLEEPGPCAPTPVGFAELPVEEIVQLAVPRAPRVWSHRLGEILPDCIPAADDSLDEVCLEGTFNACLPPDQPRRIFLEAWRALRPGGQLLLRGLTADRVLEHAPKLNGPAAVVENVPMDRELLAAVEAANFIDLTLLTFGETYCFAHAGANLRETRLSASKPLATSQPRDRFVVYRGPFAELRDDTGFVFRRGERVAIDEATWTRLQAMGRGEQFVLC